MKRATTPLPSKDTSHPMASSACIETGSNGGGCTRSRRAASLLVRQVLISNEFPMSFTIYIARAAYFSSAGRCHAFQPKRTSRPECSLARNRSPSAAITTLPFTIVESQLKQPHTRGNSPIQFGAFPRSTGADPSSWRNFHRARRHFLRWPPRFANIAPGPVRLSARSREYRRQDSWEQSKTRSRHLSLVWRREAGSAKARSLLRSQHRFQQIVCRLWRGIVCGDAVMKVNSWSKGMWIFYELLQKGMKYPRREPWNFSAICSYSTNRISNFSFLYNFLELSIVSVPTFII